MKYIIVVGMAHSGTTILTRTLSQHPSVVCYRTGPQAWLYENDALASGDAFPVFEFAARQSVPYILMKRPWVCHRPYFLVANWPDAYYLYMQREREEIFKSWAKPTSMVETRTERAVQEAKYNDSLEAAARLEAMVPHFLRIKHEELCLDPAAIFKQIIKFTDLPDFGFDFSEINSVDIKKLLLFEMEMRFLREQIQIRHKNKARRPVLL
jgi:hypothetical protein